MRALAYPESRVLKHIDQYARLGSLLLYSAAAISVRQDCVKKRDNRTLLVAADADDVDKRVHWHAVDLLDSLFVD